MKRASIVALAIFVVSTVATFAAVEETEPSATSSAPVFELAEDPSTAVFSFTEIVGELVTEDHPSVKVFSDGRVVVHHPSYKVNAGDFIGKMTPEELEQFAGTLIGLGLVEFDVKAARNERQEFIRQSREFFHSSDPSTMVFEVRLASYTPTEGATEQVDVARTVNWTGLRGDLKRSGELPSIRSLGAARNLFLSLEASIAPLDQDGDR